MSSTARCAPPEVGLRVPGQWKSVKDLAERLPSGFRIRRERLCMPGGRRVWFGTLPADNDFPRIFRIACLRRLPRPRERRVIDHYTMNAVLAAPGGSRRAAQILLEAGAALLEAGGAGVFIDNSLLAHGGRVWSELAEHRDDPDALFYGFVSIVRLQGELLSHGMHVLGHPDGVIVEGSDVAGSLYALEDLLREVFEDHRALHEGDTFRDQRGKAFRLSSEPCDNLLFDDHPMDNPYGRWRLEALASGAAHLGGAGEGEGREG